VARCEREIYREWERRAKLNTWVARIAGLDAQYGFRRTFMRGVKDFALSNSVGSRGIYEYFFLEPGIYEVNKRTSWKRAERFFIRIHEDSSIERITREEVIKCLTSDTSESVS